MNYEVRESYKKTDIQGRTYEYTLCKGVSPDGTEVSWKVEAWEIIPDKDFPENGEPDFEHMWTSEGVPYEEDGFGRQKRHPHTEETARAEFERWRK